jgi:hypothetical protein
VATTNFNLLHLRFARRMRDPVSAADGAGTIYSSANREDYLNRANKILQFKKFAGLGRDGVREQLQTVIGEQALTFASAGIACEAAYNNIPLAVSKTGSTNLYKYWPRKEEIELNLNPDLPYLFAVEANTLYVYESGVLIPAQNTGTFYYIKSDQVATVTGAGGTDILLPSVFYDELVDIAVELAMKEKVNG